MVVENCRTFVSAGGLMSADELQKAIEENADMIQKEARSMFVFKKFSQSVKFFVSQKS